MRLYDLSRPSRREDGALVVRTHRPARHFCPPRRIQIEAKFDYRCLSRCHSLASAFTDSRIVLSRDTQAGLHTRPQPPRARSSQTSRTTSPRQPISIRRRSRQAGPYLATSPAQPPTKPPRAHACRELPRSVHPGVSSPPLSILHCTRASDRTMLRSATP